MLGEVKLTKAQRGMLKSYKGAGPTEICFGRMTTWGSLVSRGLLARSFGLGTIITEITPKGLAALGGSGDE